MHSRVRADGKPKIKIKINFFPHIRADRTSVRANTFTHPRGHYFLFFIFFPHPCGWNFFSHVYTDALTRPRGRNQRPRRRKNKIKQTFFVSARMQSQVCVDGARIRADGVLPRTDAVKICPRVKLHPWDKNERTRTSGR
jgi:hypothetical protein